MNLFKLTKDKKELSNCIFCEKEFKPDNRNVKRNWGLSCSKSCAVSYRNYIDSLSDSEKITENRDKRLKQLGI